MGKKIKKIIATVLMSIVTFTLIGCGQSKSELKEEIKQEIKDDEVKTKEQVKIDELSDVTKESLAEFEKEYKEYQNIVMKSKWFILEDDSDKKITPQEGREYKKQADNIKESISRKAPNTIKEELKKYFDLYDSFFNKLVVTLKYSEEESILWDNVDSSKVRIDKKIKELREQLIVK